MARHSDKLSRVQTRHTDGVYVRFFFFVDTLRSRRLSFFYDVIRDARGTRAHRNHAGNEQQSRRDCIPP